RWQTSRHRRQAGLPKSHGRIRAEAPGPGWAPAAISEKFESLGCGQTRLVLELSTALQSRAVQPIFKQHQNLSQKEPDQGVRPRLYEAPTVIFNFLDFSSTLFASFSLCATSFFSSGALESARICAAKMPAFVAPGFPIATVATGIPAGICT